MSQDVTLLLLNWKKGDKDALNQLIPILYNELYKIARKCLSNERSNHTLQATALVNEAYLKLIKLDSYDWKNRAQFLAIASQVMRNILVDYARKYMADKRANPRNKICLETLIDQTQTKYLDLIDLDNALNKFALIDKQQSQIIEMRFFGGLTIEEIAEVLQLSPTFVWREWETARLWLFRELIKE